MSTELVEARATVRLQGVAPGEYVLVDPKDPYIRKLLESGWLVLDELSLETASVLDEDDVHRRDDEIDGR